ncbi:MAG TPA: hypothetical protein VFY85_01040 [Gemmatimonadaceae bacterium]|nr:hypothetical protein [Gemmatimonadaceae bacterium]
MHLLLVALALQLRTVALAAPVTPPRAADALADSVRAARRARSEQASFERSRRAYLPNDPGADGRCDVHVGRFCWWSDATPPALPPEAPSTVARRALLISLFDSLLAEHPGDDWIAGMAVHYRIESHDLAAADSAARRCRGTGWWCAALVGYAAHARGEVASADSAFNVALAAMPEEQRCDWTDIHTLLPGDARGRYEKLPCADRAAVDSRYWMLARPRLASPANDWHSEFLSRRVQAWLARRSLTPQGLGWGDDAEELLLRFGWPVRWGRVEHPFSTLTPEVSVIGHDPWPSFDFGPREALLDSTASAASDDDGWDLHSQRSVARYQPHGVDRLIGVTTQLARFRRADSTLLVSAFFVGDDSIRAPDARLAATLADGTTFVSAPDSTMSGALTLMVPGEPAAAGVEITDSVSHTFARSRTLLAPQQPGEELSTVLLYRGGGDPPEGLDSAVARAIPASRVERTQPVGLYWEAYRAAGTSDSAMVSISVERVDRSIFRSAFQKLGISQDDSPLRLAWTDTRPVVAGVSTYAVSLDLGNLAPGRYRISLSLGHGDHPPLVATRELELVDH